MNKEFNIGDKVITPGGCIGDVINIMYTKPPWIKVKIPYAQVGFEDYRGYLRSWGSYPLNKLKHIGN